MKKYQYAVIALASFIFIGCGGSSSDTEAIPPNEAYQTISGKVVSIADGDTLTILDDQNTQHKIRLSCIDAPEKGQDFGTKAKDALSALVGGKVITVTYKDTDQYGRILGKIEVGNIYVNLKQVQDGMAWVYRKYCTSCEFYDSERYARNTMMGLWSQPNPVPPWEYRKDPEGSKNIDWSYLYSDTCPTSPTTPPDNGNGDGDYSCGSKKYCTQMNSCDEAYFYFESCGLDRLDGDNDGVPCESLCR
jgi:endonuclease YncB( thermonuclease family)